ncbi:glucocorticoid modulatory element-binding protein 2-like [Sinocyclocheilus anshuiensis]|uniref:glucocorticoid modulatory element-binding protein 2-like n=1 Tax=Sinocyclocheilus anshuiensis TaxID=1608454 RepID=UPI0007B90FFA|nr:PREDICTED: glucocorticoid modulatory element-binding protein 2-like [Sinocyclocheilus anshuiensis]
MASSSEVNVHMEEVVVVTTPDTAGQTSSAEEEKNILVATDLEQSGENIMEQTMESEAESSATISLPKDTVLVKISEDADVEGDILYPITCGDSKANLVWKKFVCPGINIKCVLLNEHLISPKEFVYIAGKSTLKDWKRAIRLNGTMLRKIMDSGELDFYQHSRLCSNTCRSTKIDLLGSRVSFSSQQSTETTPATPASVDVNGSSASISADAGDDSTEWVTAIGEDTMTFWRGLKDEKVSELNFFAFIALEQQCDEHRKRAKELKSKSQHLNNVLMTMTPVTSPPTAKRPRLTRAVSGPATVASTPAQPMHFTLPITQLAGFPLDKVLSVPTQSPLIGGYTVLTSPGGTELQSEGSNLTLLSTAAVPQGSTAPTIVKVVSPFQLVTLPTVGAGATVQNLAAPVGGAVGGTVVAVPVSAVSSVNTATVETVGPQAATEQKDDQKE